MNVAVFKSLGLWVWTKLVLFATWFWGPATVRSRVDAASGTDLMAKALTPVVIMNIIKDTETARAVLMFMFGDMMSKVVANPQEFAFIFGMWVAAWVVSFILKINLPPKD